MTSHALVVGAGVAGLSLSWWLERFGWRVTVVEKAPSLRVGGQNVDVHGPGRAAVERMGLLDAVRAAGTGERGTRFVDDLGRDLARFPVTADDSGTWTRQLEVLRGDLVQILAGAVPHGQVRFADTVVGIEDRGDDVLVRFERGEPQAFDLVVGADGLGSQVRRIVFGDEAQVRDLGLEIAWATIPREPSDVDWWSWYSVPGGSVQLRPDPHGTMRAMLTRTLGAGVDPVRGLPRDEQLAAFEALLGATGWQSRRVLDAVGRAEDLYVESVAQVHAPRWSAGRVVLVGDAGYCASPVSGMGTSLALAGACVLAGELAAHVAVRDGLASYERVLRPWVREVQTLPPGVPRVANPRTAAGVRAFRAGVRLAASRPARWIGARLSGDGDEGFVLPDYSHLQHR